MSTDHPAPLRFLDRLIPSAPASAWPALHATRPWVLQLIIGVGVFFCAQAAGGTVMIVLNMLSSGGLDLEALQERTSVGTLLSSPGSFIAGAMVAAVVSVAGYWLLMRLLRQGAVAEMGGPGILKETAVGLGIGTVLIGLVFAILAAMGAYRIVAVGWDGGILVGLGAGIMAGFAEEILYRGVLLRLLEAWLGSWWALALTSASFGLMHVTNPEASVFGAVAIALEAGILMGACFMLTRRLWLTIGVHIAWNFVQGGVFGSDISGVGTGRGLFEASFTGSELITGGEMGIEASVIAIAVCLAAGLALLALAHRRGMIVAPSWRRRARSRQDALAATGGQAGLDAGAGSGPA